MSLAERTVSTSSGHALTLLYKEHAADAFRYAVHLTGRRADAEDIVQQVFLQAYRHLESGRQLVSPRAWLLTAVKHRAFNLARDRREVPVDAPVLAVDSRDASGDEAAQLAEVRGMLWTLPEPQHHAFVLRHWSGLSQNEIADVLETTPSAVESLLGRARLTLLRAHDTASDASARSGPAAQVDGNFGRSDLAHLGTCRQCRQAHGRLMRAANVAGALALVPGTHVAHSIAGLVPGFSAHAATSTAAAVGGAGGAGAGATGVSTGLTTTTTAATARRRSRWSPRPRWPLSRVGRGRGGAVGPPRTGRADRRAYAHAALGVHPSRQLRPPARRLSVAGHRSPTLPTPAPPNTGGANAGSHRPAQNPGHDGGAGQGLGKPATPGSGKPASLGNGTALEAEATGRPSEAGRRRRRERERRRQAHRRGRRERERRPSPWSRRRKRERGRKRNAGGNGNGNGGGKPADPGGGQPAAPGGGKPS